MKQLCNSSDFLKVINYNFLVTLKSHNFWIVFQYFEHLQISGNSAALTQLVHEQNKTDQQISIDQFLVKLTIVYFQKVKENMESNLFNLILG